MNKEFDAVTTSTKGLSDFSLVMKILGEKGPDAPKPDFLTVGSWFMLHERVHSGRDNDFIHGQDIVEDRRFNHEDTRQVFGFQDDKDGREALQIMHSWLGNTVWKRAPDGTYQPFDMETLGDNPHIIDLNNPDQLKKIVHEVLKREGAFYSDRGPCTKLTPVAAAIKAAFTP